MRFNILADAHWESKLDLVLNELSGFEFRQYFEARSYGAGLDGVTVVFICQNPSLSLKRRIRLSKKEKKLYMDIMLDLPAMKAATLVERKRTVAHHLYEEVPQVFSRYKIANFHTKTFIADLLEWIDSTGW